MKRLGLIVNPVAGLGGRVGLKGSDGQAVQRRAQELGAEPRAPERAAQALAEMTAMRNLFELITPPGLMGEVSARQAGFSPTLLGSLPPHPTSAQDTMRCAQAMQSREVDLLLFAGGDGTARDIQKAIGEGLPALGIPAGVKIHSAVFAVQPRLAGELAWSYLQGKAGWREAEVVDLDEEAYRQGQIAARLYGYLRVPYRRGLVQNKKTPTPASEAIQAEAIAADLVENMQAGVLYVLGPGSTTRAVATRLGLPKTLVGVDVVANGELVAADVNESQLLARLAERPGQIVATPVGGQGFLFGRGNQQISPRVIQQVGRQQIRVVCLQSKLNALRGQPLLVDTGDEQTDRLLSGYMPVITGYRERVIYRIK